MERKLICARRKPLLEIYAVAVSLALLYFVVRESSPTLAGIQCNCASRSSLRSIDNRTTSPQNGSSSRDFGHTQHGSLGGGSAVRPNYNETISISPQTQNGSSEKGSRNFAYNDDQRHNNQPSVPLGASRVATFPIRTHILSHGKPRTATSLLFNMATISYFLYLSENDPDLASNLTMSYTSKLNLLTARLSEEGPRVVKTHNYDLEDYMTNGTVIFTTAIDRKEAAKTKDRLSGEGHAVAFVQDMESLKEFGSAGLVPAYVAGFGLSPEDRDNMIEYFSQWEILRQCCGKQMSERWRNDLYAEELKVESKPHHPTCANHDMDAVERAFMDTELYSLIDRYPNMRPMNKPSIVDGTLNGTYCSGYSHLVHTQGLNFWGVPKKTPLDENIRKQFKLGTSELAPEGAALLRDATLEEVWARSTKHKEKWLETVRLAREKFKLDTTTSTSKSEARLGNTAKRKEEKARLKVNRRDTAIHAPK